MRPCSLDQDLVAHRAHLLSCRRPSSPRPDRASPGGRVRSGEHAAGRADPARDASAADGPSAVAVRARAQSSSSSSSHRPRRRPRRGRRRRRRRRHPRRRPRRSRPLPRVVVVLELVLVLFVVVGVVGILFVVDPRAQVQLHTTSLTDDARTGGIIAERPRRQGHSTSSVRVNTGAQGPPRLAQDTDGGRPREQGRDGQPDPDVGPADARGWPPRPRPGGRDVRRQSFTKDERVIEGIAPTGGRKRLQRTSSASPQEPQAGGMRPCERDGQP